MDDILPETELEENLFSVDIDGEALVVDVYEIGKIMGYRDKSIPGHFEQLMIQAIEQLPKRCKIQAGYRIADFELCSEHKDQFDVSGIRFSADRIITSKLKHSTEVALFLCSIGSGMEDWIVELNAQHDLAAGYIANTIASTAVESAVNILHDHIGLKMKGMGLGITNRYSPGYCNWSVVQQHLLFRFFPKSFCGVKLNETALMFPIKSVSGIIGIGEQAKYREYDCDHCGVVDCTYRTIRLRRTG